MEVRQRTDSATTARPAIFMNFSISRAPRAVSLVLACSLVATCTWLSRIVFKPIVETHEHRHLCNSARRVYRIVTHPSNTYLLKPFFKLIEPKLLILQSNLG